MTSQVIIFPEPVGNSDFEVVAEMVMEILERFDQQVIDREPNGTAPVGIAAKQSGRRLAGLVGDAVLRTLRGEFIGEDV